MRLGSCSGVLRLLRLLKLRRMVDALLELVESECVGSFVASSVMHTVKSLFNPNALQCRLVMTAQYDEFILAQPVCTLQVHLHDHQPVEAAFCSLRGRLNSCFCKLQAGLFCGLGL